MKGEWKVDAAGRTYLDTGDDPTALQAERDAAQAKLAQIQAAHDTLLAQVANPGGCTIAQAGAAITSAEP